MSFCWSTSPPPVVTQLDVSSPLVENATATITCGASDSGGNVLSLNISVTGGTLDNGTASENVPITAGGSVSGSVTWSLPAAGPYTVTCTATADCNGGSTSQSNTVAVGGASAPPVIDSLSATTTTVQVGQTVTVTASAHDPAGSALTYQWSATSGTISGSGPQVTWTAPSTASASQIQLTVSNGSSSAVASLAMNAALTTVQTTFAGVRTVQRVAVGYAGEVYAVDSASGSVTRLGRDGAVLGTLAVPEAATAVAVTPTAIIVSTQAGNLFRVDPGSGRAQPFPVDAPLVMPSGLAYQAATGMLWVAERGAGRIRAVRADGSTALLIDNASGVPLMAPVDVAIDPSTGLVWAVEMSNETGNSVHAFDSTTGVAVKSLFPFGGGVGQVTRAGGMTIDASSRIYVSDAFQGAVQVVSNNGDALGTIGAGGQLCVPTGVAIAINGDLLVGNFDVGTIERYGNGVPEPKVCAGDSDCDGLPDWWEVKYGLNPYYAGDAKLDADGDGLTNLQEYALGTNPLDADTDHDGISDGVEVANGTNPLVSNLVLPVLTVSGPAMSAPGLVRFSAALTGAQSCTIAWTQVAGPAATLRGTDGLTPSLIARGAGTYRLQGIATCGAVSSAPAVAEVKISNVAPRADAGRTVVTQAGRRVSLDGSFSSDANGDSLTFGWTQIVGPAVISSASSPKVVVLARKAGLYGFELSATDPAGAKSTADVPMLVLPSTGDVATAVVASPVLGTAGATIALDASGSIDASSVRWSQLEGAPVVLANAGRPVASFVAPSAGHYAFEASITGDHGRASVPARVDVYVSEAGSALPRSVVGTGPIKVAAGTPVDLDGSASAGSGGTLAYTWRQVSGPAAGLTDTDHAVATAVPFTAGVYVFELSVAEGAAVSLPARVQVEAAATSEAIPVAAASGPGLVYAGNEVKLDGSGSSDADGHALRYRWTQVAGPWVALDDATSAAPTFFAAKAGLYSFELEVDDLQVRSAPAAVSVWVFDVQEGAAR